MEGTMGLSGAELFVGCLEAQGVEVIFTVPGASIDPILDVLVDHGPKIILCRHEQNAAFMAQAYGRITGKPGVCLATAGPGLTNLVTGIATAWSERSPVVAITGQLPSAMQYKRAHQNIDAVGLFRPITKWNCEISHVESVPDAVATAFRLASAPQEAPTHISIPSDVLKMESGARPITPHPYPLGRATEDTIREAAERIKGAKNPVLLLGLAAGKAHVTAGLRPFLERFEVPICATFEAAGAVPRKLVHRFMGRLGVFKNQPGDKVLDAADLVIAIGFDPVEYDPSIWNKGLKRTLIHIDEVAAQADQYYQPDIELVGDIPTNLKRLADTLGEQKGTLPDAAQKAKRELDSQLERGKSLSGTPIHPLRLIYELRQILDDTVTVVSDVGSHQYWMMRHFFCYEAAHLLTSMGFQTMGISIPYAIAATLARPGTKAVSISGDGSFLMCSMELETAVRLKSPIIHLVWEDAAYDLVRIQQLQKYGRDSAAHFGQIDTVKYAESMGAKGMRLERPDQIESTLKAALAAEGPVVISVPIDYSENAEIVRLAHTGGA
ncbi:MAG: acetolactate synthase AlsS [Parachlamydiales bacterium]